MFIDIEKELKSLSQELMIFRIPEFEKKHIGIHLCAIGGFPIKEKDGVYTLLDQELNESSIKENLKEALGLSGMLTYMNKSNLSLVEMGELCSKLNHTWANNWINLSFLICLPGAKKIELALLRNGGFYESWPVHDSHSPLTESHFFGITGSVKDFIKFIKYKDDLSFDADTRKFMNEMDEKFKFIWNL